MNSAVRLPFPVLVADIGGTNARFALKPAAGAPLSAPVRLGTAGFATPEAAVETALAAGGFARPRSLLIGAAGPVKDRAVHLTNANWTLDGPRLIRALGLDQGLLFNDFETLALALPALGAGDLATIGAGRGDGGTRLAIGPGTGLGVGALAPAGAAWLPLSSEGGHIGLAPRGRDERALFDRLAGAGVPLQGEHLLAGPALGRIHAALTGAAATPEAITAGAIGDEPAARATITVWLDLLARFCGDMALTFLATGGVYLAGGILPRVAGLIDPARFRARFADNSVHAALLGRLPVHLITAAEPALAGLGALADGPERYLIDYPARLWR